MAKQFDVSKAAFLDRDGVINVKLPEGQYVVSSEQLHILPGVAAAIAMLNGAGFVVIVVSNQRCVAKGLVTTADLELIHQRMCEVLASAGAIIDAVYYCPHERKPPCTCRKPEPGMLLNAARIHQIDLLRSWMIGDSAIDVEAGRSAGCKTARLQRDPENDGTQADVVAPSLLDAIDQILKLEQDPSGWVELSAKGPWSHEPTANNARCSARLPLTAELDNSY